MNNIKKWICSNKIEFICLILLLLITSFFRFYQIGKLNFFVYDQARDALFIKRIIVDHKFRLIGTQSSIPGLYTGPAYYYLMAPFLYIFKMSPSGIDFATALFGSLTVLLVYYTVKLITNNFQLGIMAAFLYSTQFQVLEQSKFSWNPNPSPLFFMLFLLGLFKLLEKKRGWWLVVFASLGILLQLHYSGVCLIPVLLLFIILNKKRLSFGKYIFFSIILFLFLMSPLLFFDMRHNYVSVNAIFKYIKFGTGGNISPPPFFKGFLEKFEYLLIELPFGIKNNLLSILITLITFCVICWNWLKNKKDRSKLIILLTILFLGMLTANFYRGSFFNFYLTLMYPFGFILIFFILKLLYRKLSFRITVLLIFLLVLINNLFKIIPYLKRNDVSEYLKPAVSIIAQDIKESKSFNIVGISGSDRFDYNGVDYRYFLETYFNKKSLDWDVLDYENAEILYVISRVGELDPIKLNIWEVQQFNPKEVIGRYTLNNGIIIYKLSKNNIVKK